MNIKELRIDNYLKHTEDTIAELPSGTKTMLAKKDGEFKVSASTMYTMSLIEKKGVDPFKQLKYAPIPLNEEWLLKFGFDNKNNPTQTSFIHWIKKIQTYNGSSCFFKIYQEKNKLNYKKNMEGKMIKEFMFFYKEMGVINLDYVHSLQNLYACLTNKELTLKD